MRRPLRKFAGMRKTFACRRPGSSQAERRSISLAELPWTLNGPLGGVNMFRWRGC